MQHFCILLLWWWCYWSTDGGGGGGDGGNGHSGDKDIAELVVLVQVVLPPLLQVVMATLLAAYLGIERIAEHASRLVLLPPEEGSVPGN